MKQTILTEKGIKKPSKIKTLYIKRQALYDDLVQKLSQINSRKKDLVKNYLKEVKPIDGAIKNEQKRNRKF